MREFPDNQWWVAARCEDVGRDLIDRVVLGTPVLLYRTLDGRPVALDNRCVHRSFPLSKGRLIGDEVQCGYHGLRYDTSGACVCIPSQEHVASGVRVASFPVREQHPYVWVWMGDPDAVDDDLPDPGWVVGDEWAVLSGTMHIKGSWRAMHDNLLDLSHLTFLHNGVGGTAAYAQVTPEVESDGKRLWSQRQFIDESPGAGWALGIQTPIERSTRTDWRSPALLVVEVKMTDVEARSLGEERAVRIRYMHAITPESSTSLQYHWVVARDFWLESEELSKTIYEQSMATFVEDADAMEWILETTEHHPRTDPVEISIKTDAAGLKARKLIDDLVRD